MLICDEHKFIFLRNPKTASRSVTKALKDNFTTRNVGNYHSWKISKELTGYFVFTTVRNPYERTISGWQHWVGNGKNFTLKEFLDIVVRSTKEKKWPNGLEWKVQAEMFDNIKRKVHFLRYETLEEDLNFLPFVDKQIVLPQIGIQNYGDWKDHYSLDLEIRIYKLLQKDFERFGYERWHFDKGQVSLL